MRSLRIALLGLLACAAVLSLVTTASAAAPFRYFVTTSDGAYTAVPSGSIYIGGLDNTKTTRVVVDSPAGVNKLDATNMALSSSYSNLAVANLAPGDQIRVYQPFNAPAAADQYAISNGTVDIVNGSTALIGNVPVGVTAVVYTVNRCALDPQAHSVGAGAFSVPHPRILPGEQVRLVLIDASGNRASITRHSPGETPCVELGFSSPDPLPPAGQPANSKPYSLSVDHLVASASPTIRTVVRRGATVLLDSSGDVTTNYNDSFAAPPLPGDIVEIYRPKTAPAPALSVTVPPVTSVVDPTVDLIAVDSPAAGLISAEQCRPFECITHNTRAIRNAAAGRNFLNFAVSQGAFAAVDLRADDASRVTYANPDHTFIYTFNPALGDLVAPTQAFKLASKIKRKSLVKAFKKGFKMGLTSNEPGTAKLTLTLPPPTTKSKKKSKKKPKTITLASAIKPSTNGTARIYLKFTKSGKTALKKLPKKRSRSAVLTSVVTDASGNSSTVVKKTKIKT